MKGPTPETAGPSTPDTSGVEFGQSADGLAVARIGDLVFAMVPGRDGQYFLSSAWQVPRPLADLTRGDFYSHHGRIEDEPAFRARMFEQAENSRELLRLARRPARIHCNTPWGPSQGATIYAEGVVSHTTAGHGGFKLSGNHNAQVHPMLRSQDGWYEEDSAWAAVAVAFPDLFTGFERRCAARTLKDWEPDAWETISGTRLAPGESHTKDSRAFEQQHANDWVVISALRSDHHPGMTEVIATRGGRRDHGVEERRFLVPSVDYQAGGFGFVIDETRHAAFDGPSSFASWNGRDAA
ncbi:hypothetical protein G6L97_26360 (plasmid) [Agrobacterium tumefaciens]|uniref:DUF7007 domain-containing protein n=1 Tax=Agrobacterium tumefaciens TaxID=358 RepID=UPI0015735FF8|nr:hypothetical protein [Agrobacterium tumefaciens]NSZ87650.1 hypothetical protein [Agrobacterium tumefaciens]WCA72976.1 hypothetical protein G6L97_26360 [Agrobacterium tumefaciens]